MSEQRSSRQSRRHLLGRGSALAVLPVLLLALPAAAHPFIQGGGEVPVDSLASISLDLAHGCGTEASGEGADTLEVALEVPEWLRIVEVTDHPGYAHDLEVEDGRVAVVTWTEDGDPEPAPVLDLEVVADGEAGDVRHLAVFQGCDGSSYRWIGTPDEPADDPAITVRLVAADPDRPAPPPEPVEPDEEATDEGGQADEHGSEGDGGAVEAEDADTDDVAAAGEEESGDGSDEADGDSADPVAEVDDATSDPGGGGLLLIALILGIVAVVVALLAWRRRGAGRPAAPGEGADAS